MAEIPEWQYDEMRHAGVDYADAGVVAHYDEHHMRFRDYKQSAEDIISALGLRPEHTVIDMGCGTGHLCSMRPPVVKRFTLSMSQRQCLRT